MKQEEILENQDIEIRLLIEAIYQKYGYDFRNYSKAHIRRRILHSFAASGLENISAMQHKVLYDQDFLNELLQDLSINVTEMFRDPSFFLAVRKLVVPRLETYPFIKIWHAGCATGEEVYSMAIILKEEALYKNSQIYATDFSARTLEKAKAGIVTKESIKLYTTNYQKACGKQSFSQYYTARYDYAKLNDSLKEKVIFAEHNLVTDSVFGEMNMIICRNVLIYFDKILQERVLNLFYESLCPGGILCLGSKESLQFSSLEQKFIPIDKKEKIYMREYR
jgi:chemotaxis protein methyltransferase CheR